LFKELFYPYIRLHLGCCFAVVRDDILAAVEVMGHNKSILSKPWPVISGPGKAENRRGSGHI